MAEDSEKRFHTIMDKLFHAPPKTKPKSSATTSTSSQSSRGVKRPSIAAALAYALATPELKLRGPVIEESRKSSSVIMQVPQCRPWDREDLYKRMATFKSMTWFGKTEVANALNCARRGWVNVEADIIACESCGARLLFSTPSSWAQHQVEKAALVFSLKLINGHKEHCPWVDNACDETLTEFPPTSIVDLVNNYKERFASLMQLVALPVILSTAIDYIRNPQLEQFLDGPSTIELSNKSTDTSIIEGLGDECEAKSSALYYQAQKIISLCGWEPRLLPYIVDCKEREDESTRQRNLSVRMKIEIISLISLKTSAGTRLPRVHNEQASGISVYFSGAAYHKDENRDQTTSDMQYDPSSVVLDCRLCGASVGLWAFCTVPRPVEFIRLIGGSEINGIGNATHQADDIDDSGSDPSGTNISSNENLVVGKEDTSTVPSGSPSSNANLHLTIAGGPPPEKQNFCPIISLPVVGQNLRAQFSSVSQLKDQQSLKALICGDNELRPLEGLDLGVNEIPSSMENLVENINGMVPSTSTVGKSLESVSSAEEVDPVAGNIFTSQELDPAADKDLRQTSSTKAMEFDPIRQHRHFCPWIASNGSSSPGWKQTLNALQRHSSPLSAERPSSSLIKLGDPVGSVKKLFTPPSSKRKKFAHGSS